MSSPSPSSRLRPAALATVFVLFAALLMLTPPAGAAASGDTSGKAVFTFGAGKAGKALTGQKVRIGAIAPGQAKRLAGSRSRVTLRPESMSPAGTVRLKGGLRFVRGSRSVRANHLGLGVNRRKVRVFGTVAGRSMTLMAGTGGGSAKLVDNVMTLAAAGSLRLTHPAAKLIGGKLRLGRKVPAGAIGSVKVNVRQDRTPPNLDPYFAECGLSATSKVNGTLVPATPLPSMTGAKPLAGTPDIAWGFRASLRGYLGASGLHAADGAGRDGASPMAGFTFPVKGGSYKANDPVDTSDDQAVINGRGTALFCNPAHGFRIAISNPTIVIDGARSRIIASIDTNYWGIWTPAQRIDLAKLDLDGIEPFFNRSGARVSWADLPATLTAVGAESLCEPPSEGRPGSCSYSEGDELDPVTATAWTAYNPGNGSPAAWDSFAAFNKAELPFPLADPASGGCAVPDFAGGAPGVARTIDEYLDLNSKEPSPADPPGFDWAADGARPAAVPDLTGGEALSGGRLDWGVLRGIRSSTSGTGEFNLSGGATASSTYFGNGPGASEPARPGYGQKMGATSAYFTWPAAPVAGTYRQSGGGPRLLLHLTGRVALCNNATTPPIGYGTVISNPTVVIDGANSRITADVATRYRLSWVRGTVDVARFDAAEATFTETTHDGVTTVSWALPPLGPPPEYVSKAHMTTAGVTVLRMLNKDYADGTSMDPPTVTATFPES